MAELRKWAVAFILPAIGQCTWHHRYDLLTFNHVSIKDVHETLTVEDECTCRKLCVQDVECSAASVSPVGKLGFECLISHLADASKDIQNFGGKTTFIKERKPKLFYWSTTKAKGFSNFNDICLNEDGNLGTVLTIQDMEYISKNRMSEVTSDSGNFIPLRGSKTSGRTSSYWASLRYGREAHLLFKNFEDKAENGTICFKISAADGLTLTSFDCNSAPEAEVLCYKYEI